LNQVSPTQHNFTLLAIATVWALSLSEQTTTDRRLSLLSHIHQPNRNLWINCRIKRGPRYSFIC